MRQVSRPPERGARSLGDPERAADDRLAEVRELLRRAVLTLAAVTDPDARFRHGPASWGLEVVNDVNEAYGYAPPRVRRFAPTPQDVDIYLEVMGWLAWYGREVDRDDMRLFLAWAMGVPKWVLAQRRRLSESTIRRRIDAVASTIAARCGVEVRAPTDEEEAPPDAALPPANPTIWRDEDARPRALVTEGAIPAPSALRKKVR